MGEVYPGQEVLRKPRPVGSLALHDEIPKAMVLEPLQQQRMGGVSQGRPIALPGICLPRQICVADQCCLIRLGVMGQGEFVETLVVVIDLAVDRSHQGSGVAEYPGQS
jgi:hypothetical protein